MLTYAVTIFTGAFLLFQVEPLLARYILPWFGGTSAVWITCMLFFQLLLVAGYAYSHLIATRLAPRRQVIVHITIVSACVLLMGALALIWQSPITPGVNWKPLNPDFPITRIFALLLVSIGLPFFILSTTGPLLQTWFARSHQGTSPYRLYALSNVGSLLALVTYPFVVEPELTLKAQAIVWSLLFVAFAIGVGLCGLNLARTTDSSLQFVDADLALAPPQLSAPTRTSYAMWIALATVASLMLPVFCDDQRNLPGSRCRTFLVGPSALRSIFSRLSSASIPIRWYRRGIFHPALGIAIFLSCIILCRSTANIFSLGTRLLRAAGRGLYGLPRRIGQTKKPVERHLTSFYLMIAIGGALGGNPGGCDSAKGFRRLLGIPPCNLGERADALHRCDEGLAIAWIYEHRPELLRCFSSLAH